jgi:hypothetical protein
MKTLLKWLESEGGVQMNPNSEKMKTCELRVEIWGNSSKPSIEAFKWQICPPLELSPLPPSNT